MLQHLEIHGGWYGDALVDVEYCALVPQRHVVATHLGEIACPSGDEPLWLAIAAGKFAGQAHQSARSLEYRHGIGWRDLPAACGTSPVIYDRTGQLHISDCSIGSQGWRYVAPTGDLVTGDATYGPRSGVNEYTDLSDAQDGSLLIGQGNPGGGVRCFIANRLRELHPGACFDVRAKRAGEQVVISFYEVAPDGLTTHVYRGTVADLIALPLYPASAPTPPAPPPPPPPPPPTPEPTRMTLPSTIAAIITAYVARFPVPQGPSPADDAFENVCRAWTRALAEQIRFETGDSSWGVKNAGGGRPPSKDSIAQQGARLINFDLLSGVGTGRPTLISQPQGQDITGQVFMPVSAIDHLGGGTRPPQPPSNGGPVVSGATLDAAVIALIAAALAPLQAEIAALKTRVQDLEARKPVEPKPLDIDGLTIALRTDDGHYITAEGGGGQVVNARGTREDFGGWQTLVIEVQR